MTKNEKIEELRNKILRKLNEDVVEYNGDEISFYDLVKACKTEFEPYTTYFKDSIIKLSTRINKKSRFKIRLSRRV